MYLIQPNHVTYYFLIDTVRFNKCNFKCKMNYLPMKYLVYAYYQSKKKSKNTTKCLHFYNTLVLNCGESRSKYFIILFSFLLTYK